MKQNKNKDVQSANGNPKVSDISKKFDATNVEEKNGGKKRKKDDYNLNKDVQTSVG